MPLTTDEKLLALSRETIAVFDKANGGVHPGFKPAHAKGIVLTGTDHSVDNFPVHTAEGLVEFLNAVSLVVG